MKDTVFAEVQHQCKGKGTLLAGVAGRGASRPWASPNIATSVACLRLTTFSQVLIMSKVLSLVHTA